MDYQAIIDELNEDNIKLILDKLDIPWEDKGEYLIMPTYCHNHKTEDASKKLYYYKNNKIFMCYTQCQTMSIFKFLKNYYEAQGIDYDWYNDIYRLITDTTNTDHSEQICIPKYKSIKDDYENKKKIIELPQYNEGILDCFVKHYPIEWLNDGISKEAMDRFGIKYSISQNRIVIPHRDVSGRLIGVRCRILNEDECENLGKYMPIQIENIWYKHPLMLNLYGLYENLTNINKTGIVYIAEGEKSCLQAESFNMPNCVVATCGNKLNKYQINLLLKYTNVKEIVLCYDQEEIKGEDKYFQKLWNICSKYNQYCQFSFIYDRHNLLQLKQSPFDCGESVFRTLLSRRVRVI